MAATLTSRCPELAGANRWPPLLLGRPQNGSLMGAYETAKAILAHAPFSTEVVDEKHIDGFVASMERACHLARYADPDLSARGR